jgi:hypothetical protein
VMRRMRLDRIADDYDLENTMMSEFRRQRCRFGLTPSPSRYGREHSSIVYRQQIPKTLIKMTKLLAQRVSDGPLVDRLVPLLLMAAVPTACASVPLAAVLMRATSPTVRFFPR